MSKRPQLLTDVIQLAEAERKKNARLRAIFDLDSTLFDVSPRITKILHAFAENPDFKKAFPRECEILMKVTPDLNDYGVKRTLSRYNFPTDSDPKFVRAIVNFWHQGFFSNQFLDADRPYPGATEFVRDLAAAGAEILYLTGRDVPRMWDGTVASLSKYGFPLDSHANLVLKPSSDLSDWGFKKEWFERLQCAMSDEVWFFENEPTNIHIVRDACPHIKIVFVETVHSGKAPPPDEHIPRITW